MKRKLLNSIKEKSVGMTFLFLVMQYMLYAQVYNVAYNTINFGGTGVTITPKVGTGTSLNNIVLYQNVITIGGQQIDAIIRTQELSNVSSFSTYDYTGTSNAANNLPSFFSPQFSFGTGGGYAVFKIQFILGGTYNNTTNTGTAVTLQNVRLNTYDIDGNGTAGTNQYNEFGGFTTSELASPTNIATTYNAALGMTKFRSTLSANTSDVTDVKNRVRVTYDYMSEFTTKLGAEGNGLAYFFLDFSAGAAFATAVTYAAPTLDLNTLTTGVDNVSSLVAPGSENFTTGTSNITYSGSTLDNLKVSFASAIILDGSDEKISISGATSGGSIPLNFTNAQAISNVVLSGVTYSVTATVSGGVSTLVFAKSGGGTLTVANVETLIDALIYQDMATNATKAWRTFNVTILAGAVETPVAKFQVNIDNVLPVELTNFALGCESDYPVVEWSTASEHNSAYFEIQRSKDGENWDSVASIEAAGNSTKQINYTYEDIEAVRFDGYYRLVQKDIDGKEKIYGPLKSKCVASNEEFELYPNPTAGDFKVLVNASKDGEATILITNANGVQVTKVNTPIFKGKNELQIDGSALNSGLYYVTVYFNELQTIKKLIVQ